MTTIPNELTINIITSIPGFQKFKFKPSMLIKDISKDDETVAFDPLIRYSQNQINEIPENLRKKSFFNKGLFLSLVNHLNKNQQKIPATKDGIKEATRKGYIDNNIRVTLNSIFNEGSVIYVNKQPYVIIDPQWTNGDWKISTKKKIEDIDSSKITNPNLRTVVVRDEIISGEKELKELPDAVVYGPSFTGPKNVDTVIASGVKAPTATPATQASPTPNQVSTATPAPAPPPPNPAPPTATVDKDKVIEPSPFNRSNKPTFALQYFFKQNDYYGLFNAIFRECDNNTKIVLQNYLNNNTSIKMVMGSQNISKPAYLESVDGINVMQNAGGGDCFFIAVADAINYYNFYNQDKRIISGIYGSGPNLFTQQVLRTLVFNYIANWAGLDDYLTNVVPFIVDDLNTKFEEQINGIKDALKASGGSDYISPDNYIQIANDIYFGNENFLVKLPSNVPIDIANYNKPFIPLIKSEIKGYILSNNYWANQMAIVALCNILKLNIIPIGSKKNVSSKTILYIPFANLTSNNDDWNRYLFLYYNSGHYELITFANSKKVPNYVDGVRKGDKINTFRTTIFERTPTDNLTCPLYLLFLIFGSYYSSIISADDKNYFTFYRDLMIKFENSMITPTNNNPKFNNLFLQYFPDCKINAPAPTKTPPTAAPPAPPAPPASSSIDLSSIPPPPSYAPPPPPIPLKSALKRSPSPIKRNVSFAATGGAPPQLNYNPYYRPNNFNHPYYYNSSYYKPIPISDNKTNLSYIIDVYMELQPGTKISEEERKSFKCNSKWNAIRKSYAAFVGKPYVIPPLYKKYSKTLKMNENKKPNNNITKKNY